MSEPVLSLVPRLTDTKCSESVVEVLKSLLKEAEDGEIVGGAFCFYDRARNCVSAIVPGENPTLLLGQLGVAQYRLTKHIEG